MPRLSVIIPHQSNDAALECTILSVLENRPHDTEIIVVHNGSYRDPYQLQDELKLVSDESLGEVGLLNAGLLAARSPFLCVLSSGAKVRHEGWAEAPLKLLQQSRRLTAISTGLQTSAYRCLGVTLDKLIDQPVTSRWEVQSTGKSTVHAPQLACGFYRRNVLAVIGGWNEAATWCNADVELAMLMHELDLECRCINDDESCVLTLEPQPFTTADVAQLAQFAAAYGLRNQSVLSTLFELARNCCSGSIAASIAWAQGIHSYSEKSAIARRIENAHERLQSIQEMGIPVPTPALMSGRRAA